MACSKGQVCVIVAVTIVVLIILGVLVESIAHYDYWARRAHLTSPLLDCPDVFLLRPEGVCSAKVHAADRITASACPKSEQQVALANRANQLLDVDVRRDLPGRARQRRWVADSKAAILANSGPAGTSYNDPRFDTYDDGMMIAGSELAPSSWAGGPTTGALALSQFATGGAFYQQPKVTRAW